MRHRTATHCSHEFSPLSECFFEPLQKPQHLSGEVARLFATLQVIQHLLYRGASNLRSSKFKSPCRSIGVFIRQVRVFSLSTSRARHRHHMAGRLSAVPDCGSREYTIMRIDCGTTAAHGARFHFPVHLRNHSSGFVGRGGNIQHSRARRWYAHVPFLFFSARQAAQARPPFRVGGVDMQHRSEGRTGPWLAAGYAMCFRCERNGTTIRLHMASIRRLGVDIGVTRGGTLFWAVFAPKQPNRPRHAKRKLRRCQRQPLPGPGLRAPRC